MAVSLASCLASDPAEVSVRLRVLSLGAGVQSTTLALSVENQKGSSGGVGSTGVYAICGTISFK